MLVLSMDHNACHKSHLIFPHKSKILDLVLQELFTLLAYLHLGLSIYSYDTP